MACFDIRKLNTLTHTLSEPHTKLFPSLKGVSLCISLLLPFLYNWKSLLDSHEDCKSKRIISFGRVTLNSNSFFLCVLRLSTSVFVFFYLSQTHLMGGGGFVYVLLLSERDILHCLLHLLPQPAIPAASAGPFCGANQYPLKLTTIMMLHCVCVCVFHGRRERDSTEMIDSTRLGPLLSRITRLFASWASSSSSFFPPFVFLFFFLFMPERAPPLLFNEASTIRERVCYTESRSQSSWLTKKAKEITKEVFGKKGKPSGLLSLMCRWRVSFVTPNYD